MDNTLFEKGEVVIEECHVAVFERNCVANMNLHSLRKRSTYGQMLKALSEAQLKTEQPHPVLVEYANKAKK